MRVPLSRSLKIFFTDLVVWVLAMAAYVFIRFYDPVVSETGPGISNASSFGDFNLILRLGLEAGVILGIVYGVVDIFLDQQWLRKRSYGSVLLIKSAIHLVIIFSLSIWIRIEAFQMMGMEITPESMQSELADPGILIVLFYTSFVNFMINFIRQITQKFGPGNLTKFLTGRFHKPKEEARIFMFLDMKDSTTHAEDLGHVKFGELIQDCFSDLTVIENRKAEVYQYVGDEAIIYWEVGRGLQNSNCVMAYFDYMEQLNHRKAYYLAKYGIVPEFKAGLNLGQVTVTEIGDIKRDLAFLGDTMNTAARIQGLCNEYQVDILISESLNQQLPESISLKRTLVDRLALRGKQQTIGIYSIGLN